jgi:formamidopyrimidine-DNA glycosylase
MPELPEVENLVRGLAERLPGSKIEAVRCYYPAIVHPDPNRFADAVQGRRVEKLHRHGKYLFLLLEGEVALALHLGMTGQFLLVPVDHSVDKHTHLELILEDKQSKILFRDVRKFGRIGLLAGRVEQFVVEKKLGVDALAISAGDLHRLLQKTSRAIKAALLDQGILAGLGNIYTDEILFRQRISPLRKANALTLEEVAAFRRAMRSILRSAVRQKGTTISDYVNDRGETGEYQNSLSVYSRAGLPCRRCGTIILKSVVAGRGTYSCPSCQFK